MTLRLVDKSRIGLFKYIYYFIMVIYMAQMVPATNRMIAGLSAPWIPFIFPLLLTGVLILYNPVKFFSRDLIKIIVPCLIWAILVMIHKKMYTLSDMSFMFFLFYSIIVAYIHVQVFGKQLLPLYESIIILLCKISIPLWILSLIAPSLMATLASFFPETNLGHNIMYIYNYIEYGTDHYLRNSGCSWEPGRFSVMILLGLYCNILRNGVKWNSNLFWMLLALLSTMSTTGYSIAILMYLIAISRQANLTQKIFCIILFLPLVIYLFSLDFMSQKVSDQSNLSQSIPELQQSFKYHNQQNSEGEYIQSLGRFESIYFETLNIENDPLLGYGRNPKRSYFYTQISSNFILTGGLLKLFSMFGIVMGMYFYFLLYKSSRSLSRLYNRNMNGLLFLIIILSSISYEIYVIPVFTAFWLYGAFEKKEQVI